MGIDVGAFLGDYSYGLYIYAYPVQVALFTLGQMSIGASILPAILIALVPAVCSWHFLERRALKLPLPRILGGNSAVS